MGGHRSIRSRLAPTSWRLSRAFLVLRRTWWRFALWVKNRRPADPLRLHIGCGGHGLAGWFNIDLDPRPGVDLVVDVRKGLPFANVERVFAEHFLEHLTVDDGLALLCEIHRVLRPDGRLRLTTPNLEWVLSTHADGLGINRAFYGWGHRFIWSRSLLQEALESTGFAEIRWYRYGVSDDPAFSNLEGHERASDTPQQEHVLVVEATRGQCDGARLGALERRIGAGFLEHVTPDYSPRYWRDRWYGEWCRRG